MMDDYSGNDAYDKKSEYDARTIDGLAYRNGNVYACESSESVAL